METNPRREVRGRIKMIFHLIIFLADVDECTRHTDDCDVNANCLNTAGGYKCACKSGYSGNGTHCSGVYFKHHQKS